MGAMTMAFKAPKGGVPKDVTEGTSVRVRVRADAQGEGELTSIVPPARGRRGHAK